MNYNTVVHITHNRIYNYTREVLNGFVSRLQHSWLNESSYDNVNSVDVAVAELSESIGNDFDKHESLLIQCQLFEKITTVLSESNMETIRKLQLDNNTNNNENSKNIQLQSLQYILLATLNNYVLINNNKNDQLYKSINDFRKINIVESFLNEVINYITGTNSITTGVIVCEIAVITLYYYVVGLVNSDLYICSTISVTVESLVFLIFLLCLLKIKYDHFVWNKWLDYFTSINVHNKKYSDRSVELINNGFGKYKNNQRYLDVLKLNKYEYFKSIIIYLVFSMITQSNLMQCIFGQPATYAILFTLLVGFMSYFIYGMYDDSKQTKEEEMSQILQKSIGLSPVTSATA